MKQLEYIKVGYKDMTVTAWRQVLIRVPHGAHLHYVTVYAGTNVTTNA